MGVREQVLPGRGPPGQRPRDGQECMGFVWGFVGSRGTGYKAGTLRIPGTQTQPDKVLI